MVRGLLSDEAWGFFASFVIEQGPKRGRPPADHRRVLDAVFWIARTGSPWRDLPDVLGRWALNRAGFPGNCNQPVLAAV